VPVWNYSFDDNKSEQSQPIVYKGVIYVTTGTATMAVDAKTGKQIWKSKIEFPPETMRVACCGLINRGAALYDGKLFRTMLDANVIALDAKTGKELWRANAIDFKNGCSMTVAPIVVDGVVITGISGGEFGTRDFIDGWDAQTASFCTTRFISEIFPLRSEYRMWPSPPTERHCRFWISSSSFVRKVAASFSRRAARSLAFAAPSFAAAILALALAISACATSSEALASTVLVSSSAVRHSVCRSFTPPDQNWTKRKNTVAAAATAVSKPAINIPYQEISNQRLADCNNVGSTGSDSKFMALMTAAAVMLSGMGLFVSSLFGFLRKAFAFFVSRFSCSAICHRPGEPSSKRTIDPRS
jgi:hypothetical protein